MKLEEHPTVKRYREKAGSSSLAMAGDKFDAKRKRVLWGLCCGERFA